MKLKILYEDKNIIAIDKPAGIACHRDARSLDEKTIAELVLEYDKKIANVGESMTVEYKGEKIEIKRPGIVHRLDKDTSGVLLVARNQKTFELLKEQFQNHTIAKVYRCFVYGRVSDPKASLLTGKKGIINAPIGRSPKDIRMWTAGRGAREGVREAVTEYTVLSLFDDGIPLKKKETKDDHYFSYVEVYPKTGRTHQIRVHMRYLNHPIVSDPLYSANKEKALGMDRLALHACSITFQLSNGEPMTIEAPLPKDFKEVIKKYIEIKE